MKKLLIPLVVIFTLTLNAGAQDKMGKKGHSQKPHRGMMGKRLKFSDDQHKQVKTINADYRKEMQELNKNENITVKEMRDKKAALQKERKNKMDGLLTAEQKARVVKHKADLKAKKEAGYAKRMDNMKTKLNLTEEQVSTLKDQRSTMQAKAEKLKNDGSLSREQMKEQMMALKAEAKEDNKKIFTPEQLKKMEENKKTRRTRSRVK